jgi:hypothetical protein
MERKNYVQQRKYKQIPMKMLLRAYEDDFEKLYLSLIKYGVPADEIIKLKNLRTMFDEISLRLD